MEKEKTDIEKSLDFNSKLERAGGLISDTGTFQDAFDCFKEFEKFYQGIDIGGVGKASLLGEQLIIIGSNNVLDDFGDVVNTGSGGFDKVLGSFGAAISITETINEVATGDWDGWDIATAFLDTASGVVNFVALPPGVGQIVEGGLQGVSSFIKMCQAIGEGKGGKEIAIHALDSASGLFTAAAGVCALIPGGQIVSLVLLAVAGIAKVVAFIIENWDEIVAFFGEIGNWIGGAGAWIAENLGNLIQYGNYIAGIVTSAAVRFAVQLWNRTLENAAALLRGTAFVTGLAIGLAADAFNMVMDFAAGLVAFGEFIVESVFDWLGDLFNHIDIAGEARKWLDGILRQLERAVRDVQKKDNCFIGLHNGEIQARQFAQGGFPTTGQMFLIHVRATQLKCLRSRHLHYQLYIVHCQLPRRHHVRLFWLYSKTEERYMLLVHKQYVSILKGCGLNMK